MQLVEFRVEGVRCLTNIGMIPIARPTILTGPNDSGKTAAILGLGFLLGLPLKVDDLTLTNTKADRTDEQPTGQSEAIVTGVFRLTVEEQEELGLPDKVILRRRQNSTKTSYELRASVPTDERLRDFESQRVAKLRELVEELGIDAPGHRGRRDTFLDPLRQYTTTLEYVDDWIECPRDLIQRLPRFMHFASTEAPDPEQDVRSWLSEEYERVVTDEEVVGPVAKIEQHVQQRLAVQASALRDHIRSRCEDHSDLAVVPTVSFRSGLTVELHHEGAPMGGGIRLRNAGAGSKRRVTLAVWEWVSDLLSDRDRGNQTLVIAYDEPDTHLDYLRQRDLIDLIKNQTELEGVQVVVVTHSLNLIDKIDMRGVVHLQIVNGQPTVQRLLTEQHGDIDQHLQRIASSMGLRNSVLLHERCFLVVEGSTELQSLPILFQAATGLSLQAAGIALVAGNGNKGALDVARFLRNNGRTVRFIVDTDSQVDRSTRRLFTSNRLQQYGFEDSHVFYVGNQSDIEDLFSDEAWATVANKEWPRENGEPWLPNDFLNLRDERRSFGSQLEDLVRPVSTRAPNSKPGYLLAVAESVETRNEVPEPLCKIFDKLSNIAN